MRDIKFRAWEKTLKEIIPVHSIDFEKKIINTESAWRIFDEVEIMQYTGLKDKNGKEIYEGDILKGSYWVDGWRCRHIGKVEYRETGFKVVGINKYKGVFAEPDPVYEIIGNIYEHPHLLEERK